MNFCSNCGAAIVVRVPDGDTLPRHVCNACDTIHYRNPLVVVGSIPVWEDQVLLCKRAIEPRLGKWTLPAGFMELGESVAQGAIRETEEEAKARVTLGDVFTMLSVPHVNQVHIFYRAQLLDLNFGPGSETLEVALFAEERIPWQEIAFRTVSTTLTHFYADRRRGAYRVHTEDILAPKNPSGYNR